MVGVGSEDLRRDVEQRFGFGVAVALALDRFAVDAERDVVDEDLSVDDAEVDATFSTFDGGIEGSDSVVAVDAEVECEMIASARRNARVRQIVRRRDVGDDRLRTVAASHCECVGTVGDGALGEGSQIVSLDQFDGPVTPTFRLVGEVEPVGFAVAGASVVDEYGSARGRDDGQRHRDPERPRRRGDGDCEQCDHDECADQEPPTAQHDDDDGDDSQDHRDDQFGEASVPDVEQAVDGESRGDKQEDECDESDGELVTRRDDGDHHAECARGEREDGKTASLSRRLCHPPTIRSRPVVTRDIGPRRTELSRVRLLTVNAAQAITAMPPAMTPSDTDSRSSSAAHATERTGWTSCA